MSCRDDKARTVRYQFSIITVVCTGTYALFQRTGSQSSQCNRRIGNCNPSFTRSGNGRHSNLRGCNRGHVSIARRIQINEDCNSLTHDRTGGSGKCFPRGRVGLQCLDCGVAAPHSSHCYRRFNNSRHSNLRGCNRGHVSIVGRIESCCTGCVFSGCHARCCNRAECSLRFLDGRHSNLRGYNGIERSRVADDSRHSNLRGCYRRHSNLMRRKDSSFGVLVCIINIPKSERGITT